MSLPKQIQGDGMPSGQEYRERRSAHFLIGVLNLCWIGFVSHPTVASAAASVAPSILTTGLPQGTTEAQSVLPANSPAFDPFSLRSAVLTQGDIVGEGIASWYGGRHWAGRRTASGRRFNPNAMTAASATLPLGERVLVQLEGTARSVVVTITDRLGAVDRVIDLSTAAARKIGILAQGTARVILVRM